MPNWAEGHIKIRGKTADIKKFLQQVFSAIPTIKFSHDGPIEIPREHEYEVDGKMVLLRSETNFYMEGSHRHFIQKDQLEFHLLEDEEQIEIPGFSAAWSAKPNYFIDISKKYNLAMKIYTWECGGQTNQVIEVDKGELLQDKNEQFDDYFWESTFGDMGG